LVDERRSRKLASDGLVTTYAKQPPYYSPDSGIMHWLPRKIVDSRYESFMKWPSVRDSLPSRSWTIRNDIISWLP